MVRPLTAVYKERKEFVCNPEQLLDGVRKIVEKTPIRSPMVKMYWKVEAGGSEKEVVALGIGKGIWKLFTPANPDDTYVLFAQVEEAGEKAVLNIRVTLENSLQSVAGKTCKRAVEDVLSALDKLIFDESIKLV